MILTFKYRVKDASAGKHLQHFAMGANQVWNFCVATQREAERRWKAGAKSRWLTHFDLVKLVTGAAAELGVHSDTANKICAQFVMSRDQHKVCPRFRTSFGAKRALGWIPFIPRAIRLDGKTITYKGRKFHFWKSRDIPEDIRCGAFVQDARGRWYVTFQCEVTDTVAGDGAIGIDLGLKSFASMSNGEVISAQRIYRTYEAKLATAQRANNKTRVKSISAKIAAIRKDFLHKLSTRLVRENSFIAVGDVSASKLKKTKMAKSVSDAGWSTFRAMLAYKSRRARAVLIEVDERLTSQTCSACGALSASRPKGIAGLRIRFWQCSDCGASHDRDVNSASNILRIGLERQPLVGEISVLQGGEDVNLAASTQSEPRARRMPHHSFAALSSAGLSKSPARCSCRTRCSGQPRSR